MEDITPEPANVEPQQQPVIELLDAPDPDYKQKWFKVAFGREYNPAEVEPTDEYEAALYKIRLASLPGANFEDLHNYCYNMIHYYETRIKDVEKLIEKMSVGSGLAFAADLAIMDQQANGIVELIGKEESLRSINESTKDQAIKKYQEQVGSRSSEVMNKDYDNRNRTIRYTLLINEYKEKIKKIRRELYINGAPPIEAIKVDMIIDEEDNCLPPTDCTMNMMDEIALDNPSVYKTEYPELADEEEPAVVEGEPDFEGGSKKYTRHNHKLKPRPMNKTRKNVIVGGGITEIDKTIEQISVIDKQIDDSGLMIAMDPVFTVAYNSILYTMNYIKNNNLRVTEDDLYDFLYDDVSTLRRISKDYMENAYKNARIKQLNSMAGGKPRMIGGGWVEQTINIITNYYKPNKYKTYLNWSLKDLPRNSDGTMPEYSIFITYTDGTNGDVTDEFIVSNEHGLGNDYLLTNDNIKLSYKNAERPAAMFEDKNLRYMSFSDGSRRVFKTAILKWRQAEPAQNTPTGVDPTNKKRRFGEITNEADLTTGRGLGEVVSPRPTGVESPDEDDWDDDDFGGMGLPIITPAYEAIKKLWEKIRGKTGEKPAPTPAPAPNPIPNPNVPSNPIVGTVLKPPEPDKLPADLRAIWDVLPKDLRDKVAWELEPDELRKQFEILKQEKEAGDIGKKKAEDIDNVIGQLKTEYDPVIKQFTELAAQYKKMIDKLNKDLAEQEAIIEASKKQIEDADAEILKKIKELSELNEQQDDIELQIAVQLDHALSEDMKDVTLENELDLKLDQLYVKKQLYNFTKICEDLDSVPEWRAMLVRLIYSYMRGFLISPNANPITGKNEPLQNKPGYQYFNIILKGNPGIGKSYSSEKVGLALMYSGLLTKGKLIPIKKPEIIGQYTGQTAPKVYNELSGSMGNIVFLDEAYSIAGKMDETKGTYNEFGQEALDAITDFTSEHIGLFGIVAAGYSYEMQKQFLDVNIGLPRRFPTVLTLNRYDMNSYWKIIKSPLIKISPSKQVNEYHRACFEILNIMFNNAPHPNPLLKLSKNFDNLFKLNTLVQQEQLTSIDMNLKVGEASYPIMSLKPTGESSFNGRTTKNVSFLPFEKYIDRYSDIVVGNYDNRDIETTAAYLKSFFLFLYTGLLNGDPFRSQADNLTKFAETILNDKIFNGGGLFDQVLETDKVMNFAWIEYIYFKLYLFKNPNNFSVNNVDYEFVGRDAALTKQIIDKMKRLVYFSESLKPEIYNVVGEEPKYNIGSPRETYKVIKEFRKQLEPEIHNVVGEEPKYNIGSPRETYKVNKELDKQVDELTEQFAKIGPLHGGAPSNLLFNVNVDSVGDKDGLIQKVINAYIKVFKFNAGEDITKETIDAELLKIRGLLDFKFRTNDFTDVDTVYLFIILSAYITAAEEYIRPEAAFKTNGWWFFDKEHFEKIVKVLDITKILEKYNTGVALPPGAIADADAGLPPAPPAEDNLPVAPPADANLLPPAPADADAGDEIGLDEVNLELQPQVGLSGPKQLPEQVAVVSRSPSAEPVPGVQGGNKTHRFRYKTQSGKHTRSARW